MKYLKTYKIFEKLTSEQYQEYVGWFMDIINRCEKKRPDDFIPNQSKLHDKNFYIYYYIDGELMFIQDEKNHELLCYYPKIWSYFDKYHIDYQDIQDIIRSILDEYLNLGYYTPWNQSKIT
jgi:hypothetical protein